MRKKTKNAYFLKSSLRLNNISFCITFSYCHISMLCFGNTMYDRKIFFCDALGVLKKTEVNIYFSCVCFFFFFLFSCFIADCLCSFLFFFYFFQHMHASTHRQTDEQQHHISELHKGMMIMKSLREQTIRCH